MRNYQINDKRLLILDGALVSYEDATIKVTSCAMKYGASVFEGMRGYWDVDTNAMNIVCLQEHIDRLFASAKLMRMSHTYSVESIKNLIIKLVNANSIREDCYIRCALSISGEGDLVTLDPVVLSMDIFPYGRKKHYAQGMKLSISSWQKLNENMMSPRIKCVSNYQHARLALLTARDAGYDDVIFLNSHGYVSEASTSNIFFIFDGVLVTPRLEDDILPGITRDIVIRLAKIIGIGVTERPILRTEAYLADEVLLCGTGAEIAIVDYIDGYLTKNYKNVSVVKRIQEAYEAFVKRKVSELNCYIFSITPEEVIIDV